MPLAQTRSLRHTCARGTRIGAARVGANNAQRSDGQAVHLVGCHTHSGRVRGGPGDRRPAERGRKPAPRRDGPLGRRLHGACRARAATGPDADYAGQARAAATRAREAQARDRGDGARGSPGVGAQDRHRRRPGVQPGGVVLTRAHRDGGGARGARAPAPAPAAPVPPGTGATGEPSEPVELQPSVRQSMAAEEASLLNANAPAEAPSTGGKGVQELEHCLQLIADSSLPPGVEPSGCNLGG